MFVVFKNRLAAMERRQAQRLLLGFLLGLLLSLGIAALWNNPLFHDPSRHYTYSTYRAASGVKLHAMRTDPDNIELKHIRSNVTSTEEFGINGGFFWNGDLLSIAVINDKPIRGIPHEYGSGWTNIDYPKGTLVWDEAARSFSVQVVEGANQLQVTDRSRYWAQGGVSMSLGAGALWQAQARKEDMPAMKEARLRSGAVYDKENNLWLIVSDKPCTVAEFRSAVLEVIAPGLVVDGIFLDGDGSSQMRNRQVALKGDSREVYQMMALRHK
ncbi:MULTISPECIES: phosphodiester glycosidase family protein [Paenibacillus]|uniref:phosphodiester glycosidase family protein n=1 Tax=Paenibacillus TaxID=44249 RepID=UPI0022B86DC4|nr:phosphodiester glycosidase family protein [Paenibacillus caseinilyticus]MCZ8522726.1 phosphodiester glycosidase family protein [Paenibacillus caseinilyticus]